MNCPDCDSVGGSFLRSDGKCPTCHGTGNSSILEQGFAAAFGEKAPCDACDGNMKCKTCDGTGEVDDD